MEFQQIGKEVITLTIILIILLMLIIVLIFPLIRLAWFGLLDKFYTEKMFWKRITFKTTTKIETFKVERSQTRFISFLKNNVNQGNFLKDAKTNSKYMVESLTSLKNKHKILQWDKEFYQMKIK